MPRFTSFVVFAEMRTGSNLLEANLNALPGVDLPGVHVLRNIQDMDEIKVALDAALEAAASARAAVRNASRFSGVTWNSARTT